MPYSHEVLFSPARISGLVTCAFLVYFALKLFLVQLIPAGSPSRGGDVAIYVFDIKQASLPTSFYSVLVSVSVFMALSTVFYSINSPNNSPLPHSVFFCLVSVLLVLSTIYLFMKVFLNPDITALM